MARPLSLFTRVSILSAFCIIGSYNSSAATVSGSSVTYASMNVNLTTEGSLDWRQFGGTASITGSPFFNEKVGANELTVVNNATNGARGSSGTTSTWTDGTPFPATSSDKEIRFTGGLGLPRVITIDSLADLSPRRVRMYVAARDGGNGTITATMLNSANTPIGGSFSDTLNDDTDAMFELTYTGDSIGDKLRIVWGITSLDVNALSSADVTLASITLAEVPEPSSLAVLGLGALMLQRRRGGSARPSGHRNDTFSNPRRIALTTSRNREGVVMHTGNPLSHSPMAD